MTKPAWMDRAKCQNSKPDFFFEEFRPSAVKAAKKFCSDCAVRFECLDHALLNGEVGIWGGTTTNQRAKITRAKRKEAKKATLATASA